MRRTASGPRSQRGVWKGAAEKSRAPLTSGSAAGEGPPALREKLRMKILLIALTTVAAFNAVVVDASALRFDFTGGKPERGLTAISPTNLYSGATGFGFEPGGSVVASGDCVSSEK